MLAVARDGGLRVIAGRVRKGFNVAAVGLGSVDRVRAVDRPDVAQRIIRWRRASRARCKCRRVKNAGSGREIIAASRAALAVADELRCGWLSVRSVNWDRKNLITAVVRSSRRMSARIEKLPLVLERQEFVVGGTISLRASAAERKLADVR